MKSFWLHQPLKTQLSLKPNELRCHMLERFVSMRCALETTWSISENFLPGRRGWLTYNELVPSAFVPSGIVSWHNFCLSSWRCLFKHFSHQWNFLYFDEPFSPFINFYREYHHQKCVICNHKMEISSSTLEWKKTNLQARLRTESTNGSPSINV